MIMYIPEESVDSGIYNVALQLTAFLFLTEK